MKIIKYSVILLILVSIVFYFYSCKEDEVIKPVDESKHFVKTFGGSLSDRATSVQQINDGGILVAGYTISSGSGGNDGFALKLDNNGNTKWYKVFGGSADDQINSAYPVTDGGFILVGETNSFSSSSSDIYAVKLDMNGNLMWSKIYRITGNELGTSVVQTEDYGFLISGSTDGFGSGNSDALVMKIDFTGNVLWINAYGESLNDYGVSVKPYDDNSSIVTGYTFSGGAGAGDISLIRLDPNGNIAWTKYYGGTGLDQPYDVEITSDNGYLIGGSTTSFGLTNGDVYFIKTDGDGLYQWSRSFGGAGLDLALSVKETYNGQYISSGITASYGSGLNDAFVIKLFGDGVFDMAKTFGSTSNDAGTSIVTRSDTGFVLAGYTESYGAGSNDIYVIAMKENGISCSSDNPVTPGGGDPVTSVNDATIFMIPAGTYETLEAGTVINSITPTENTICSQ
jgi:hypothetical protein